MLLRYLRLYSLQQRVASCVRPSCNNVVLRRRAGCTYGVLPARCHHHRAFSGAANRLGDAVEERLGDAAEERLSEAAQERLGEAAGERLDESAEERLGEAAAERLGEAAADEHDEAAADPRQDRRILHSCLLRRVGLLEYQQLGAEARRQRLKPALSPTSVFLSCLTGQQPDDQQLQLTEDQLHGSPPPSSYPYADGVTPVQFVPQQPEESDPEEPVAEGALSSHVLERLRWLRARAVREDQTAADQDEEEELWVLRYGSADPSLPVSATPCGGCGARLHCQHAGWPGFLPAEVLRMADPHELDQLICQRCYFLRHHNTALHVQVPANDYTALMRVLTDSSRRVLVVLLVDLLDFPGSVWPGVHELIGRERPVVVVGNKVDLLPQEGPHFLKRVQSCLLASLQSIGFNRLNVKKTHLISARSGYGVEDLVTDLLTHWGGQGDIYLLGSTNTGKSTLFNALLQSDMCRSNEFDLIKRATTSQWPGTTLNLLKFPMLRPQDYHMRKRRRRLVQERFLRLREQELQRQQLQETKNPKYAMLSGHIGRTMRGQLSEDGDATHLDEEVQEHRTSSASDRLCGIEPNACWLFDTPGSVTDNQLLALLTQEELLLTLSRDLLRPRTFSLYPQQTLFVAGLGRLDYQLGPSMIRLTVFASAQLPVTVVNTCDAEDIYRQYLQRELLVVPRGDADRLRRFPQLQSQSLAVHTADNFNESCADIVLSSAGWVSVTPCVDRSGGYWPEMEFTAHTPGGVGISVRSPALLSRAVQLRGKRLRKSPAHAPSELYRLRVADIASTSR